MQKIKNLERLFYALLAILCLLIIAKDWLFRDYLLALSILMPAMLAGFYDIFCLGSIALYIYLHLNIQGFMGSDTSSEAIALAKKIKYRNVAICVMAAVFTVAENIFSSLYNAPR